MRDNTPFLESLGRRVRDSRKELGLTLQSLADRMDMSKTGLWQIEQGKSEPGAGTLWRLSRALQCSIDYLVAGETDGPTMEA